MRLRKRWSALRFGGVAGVGIALPSRLNSGAEVAIYRDQHVAGHTTSATADLTLAWSPNGASNFQIDAGLYAGLNAQTPGLQLVIGLARRF